MSYPVISPPRDDQNVANRFDWTTQQAKDFFDWHQSISEARIQILLTRLGIQPAGMQSRDLLATAGARVKELICGQVRSEFVTSAPQDKTVSVKGQDIVTTHAGAPKLTREGESLGVDMGLLTARAVVADFPSVTWKIQKSRGREVSKNLPVISGYGESWQYYCPVLVSPANVLSIAEGRFADAEHWIRVYDNVRTKLRK